MEGLQHLGEFFIGQEVFVIACHGLFSRRRQRNLPRRHLEHNPAAELRRFS